MSVTALDTSVVVAALLGWHESHQRCRRQVRTLLARRGRAVVPASVLLQSFSVMTRLPRGLGVPPERALELLRDAFAKRADVVASDPAAAWDLLGRALDADVRGGAVHDLEILECAAAAGAARLLTLNPADFLRCGDRGVEIAVP